jgi:low temperature requirement protein LtrA
VNETRSLLRPRGEHAHAAVSPVELFFDLVFVFAVTQLSHSLLEHLTVVGALQTLVLFLAVWWLWIYTAWFTNWLDPDRTAVRVLLFAMMFGGLLLSAAIPDAFGEKGWMFAVPLAVMQVGRSLFTAAALRAQSPANSRNFVRITIWFVMSAIFWIAGAFEEGDTRFAFWVVALAIEYLAPWVSFRLPVLGRSHTTDWNIEGAHLAERCALFIIIALGESILVTGATFAGLPWSETHVTGFVVAFVGSVAMWWVYFDTADIRARQRIVRSTDPGRQGRLVYTYLPLFIISGIIVSAVADEIVLTHPEHADTAGVAAILSGPALYLLGNAFFKWVTNDRRAPPLSHLGGLALLAALIPLAASLSALALGTATTVILVIVAIWESVALRRPARTRERESSTR